MILLLVASLSIGAAQKTLIAIPPVTVPANAKKGLAENVRSLIVDTVKNSRSLDVAADAKSADYVLGATLKSEQKQGLLDFRLTDVKTGSTIKTATRTLQSASALGDEVVTATQLLIRDLMPEANGQLVLNVSEKDADVSIDGKPAGVTPLGKLTLSFGDHELLIEKPRFATLKENVFVEPQRDTTLNLTLDPDKDFVAAYRSRNGVIRGLAWTGVTLAVIGAAGIFAFSMSANTLADNIQREFAALDARQAPFEDYAPVYASQRTVKTLDTLMWASVGVAVAGAALGITCFVIGDNPRRYDKPKKKQDKEDVVGAVDRTLQVTPSMGGVSVHGTF